MNKNEIYKLFNSITNEPSVLILGQDYLNSMTDSDFYGDINSELGFSESEKIHFSQLFERCIESKNVDEFFKNISNSAQNYHNVSQLKSILNMRWNFVYTSAIDGIVRQNCSANPINSPIETFKKEYGKKNPLHMAELFGNVQDDPSACPVPKEKRAIHSTKLSRLNYIEKIIGDYYGVLVVDGWNKNDWLKFDKLSQMILGRECEGTFFFGISKDELINSIPDEYKDEIIEYIEYGYIVVENESLINVLTGSGIFDDEEDETDVMDSYHISFASSKKDSLRNSLRLSKKELIGLDRNITLIHDDLTGWSSFSEDELNESFVEFLTQEKNPNWVLCGNIDKFAIKRDIDDTLLEKVKKQLSASTDKRLPILLSGVSNSGKTVSFIRLALRINKELRKNPAVVFYISDTPSSDEWKQQLQEVIKYSILHKPIGELQSINRVVLICDNIDEDITKIQEFFKEDNVLVVGSSYMHTSVSGEVDNLEISQKLLPDEQSLLKDLLMRFDKDGCNPDSIIRMNENSIFEVLSRYARFKHDRMWNSVRTHIGNKLGKESVYIEKDTGDVLFKLFTETENYILSHGIGASVEQELEASNDNNKKEWYAKNVKELNLLLATAGQFGKALPFDLVLNIIKNEMGSDSSPLNSKFFSELLRLDSMSENKSDESTGKIFVSFRSPAEAFKYLELNSENDVDNRRKTEIERLFKIIENCDWTEDYSVENEYVVKLVRCFGSNTIGRPFEDNNPNTTEYAYYWFDISDKLFKHAIRNGEALITYCHFLREAIRKHNEKHIELFNAYEALTDYYDSKKDSALVSWNQKMRICGEICSNLNSMMVKYNEICKKDHYDDEERGFIKKFDDTFGSRSFDAAFDDFEYFYKQMIKNAIEDKDVSFESNSRLDIWLNAAENYGNHGLSSKSEQNKHHEIMLKSLEYIGQMLNCNTQNDISKLLGSIANVFKYFKKDDISYKNAVELERSGNDSKIYLDVMKPFFDNYEDPKTVHLDDKDKQILEQKKVMNRNKISVYLYEFADKLFDDNDLKKCKNKATAAAKAAVDYFENDNKAAYKKAFKCNSARCLYIYLKCKWFCATEGNLLLQRKQKPALTREQWDEIYDICDKYLTCVKRENGERQQPAALLLYAFYKWRFTANIDYKTEIQDKLEECAKAMGSEAIFVRLGVCNEKGELCKFKVNIDNYGGKWYASINKNYPKCDNSILKDYRKNIYASDETLQKICKSRKFNRMLEDKTPPVNVWFNGKNPQIIICGPEGDED